MNLMDYLSWRGDLSLKAAPFGEVDALLLATLSYLNYSGAAGPEGLTIAEAAEKEAVAPMASSFFPARKALLDAAAASARFSACRVHHQISVTNQEEETQFSAMCVDLPDDTLCIAFRGTDGTLVGWQEDFNMAYSPRVPAQEAAQVYLMRAAELDERPIRLSGHSKGGNLAAYAAALAGPALQDRVDGVWSFDGPGMDPAVFASEGYVRVRGRIRSFIPQTSIVGLLMEYHRPYTVVRSDASGMQQHDPLTWQVLGPRFETRDEVDETAKMVRDTLHEWLARSTREQRGMFVSTVFRMLETTKASTLSDLKEDKVKNILAVLGERRELDPENRKLLNRLTGLFLSLGASNLVSRYAARKSVSSEEKPPEEEQTKE